VLIQYKYLIPLLVFVLLTGVVIGDRLAAEAQYGSAGDGRSGACSGLASARLHDCAHRRGSLRTPDGRQGRSGGQTGGRDTSCGYDGDERNERGSDN
jgi:hypothetical protein